MVGGSQAQWRSCAASAPDGADSEIFFLRVGACAWLCGGCATHLCAQEPVANISRGARIRTGDLLVPNQGTLPRRPPRAISSTAIVRKGCVAGTAS